MCNGDGVCCRVTLINFLSMLALITTVVMCTGDVHVTMCEIGFEYQISGKIRSNRWFSIANARDTSPNKFLNIHHDFSPSLFPQATSTNSSTSLSNSSGCSIAAKCPPAVWRLWYTMFPVVAAQLTGTGTISLGNQE